MDKAGTLKDLIFYICIKIWSYDTFSRYANPHPRIHAVPLVALLTIQKPPLIPHQYKNYAASDIIAFFSFILLFSSLGNFILTAAKTRLRDSSVA